MNSFASVTDGNDSLRTLAREATRGFVTSANDEIAFGVAFQIVSKGASLLGFEGSLESGELGMTVECSARPCISPETAVRITLTQNAQTHPKIKVSAIEYVSPWA
ncbi:hypothetical protein MCELANE86_00216 [Candidatus Nanopelagicaceae bacterium]